MSNTCLILIDWQKGFRDSQFWGPRNNPEAEKNSARILKRWRDKGLPVIHVIHASLNANSPLSPTNAGYEIEDFCKPLTDEPVYVKNVNSAFIGTSLEADLKDQRINNLFLLGVTTDHCVNTSTRMASNLGFKVTVFSDACYCHDRTDPNGQIIPADIVHNVNLASLNGEFATIMTTAQYLA